MPGQPDADVLVLGSGVAGLSVAIRAARAGLAVTVLTKGELASSATQYAQGGVAAALEEDVDSPALHLSDTISAGAGLCDVDAARVLVTEGPDRVRDLIGLGAEFDRVSGADLAYTREGGHSVARIVHAGGDATGAEIERALVHAVGDTATAVHERWFARELIVADGACAGVRAVDPVGTEHDLRARHTVLATGGAGQCFAVTTNPALSTGDGIAMARRAGVAVADVEFMQFHPTALDHPSMPRPLLSEALRGEGAVLRDQHGVAFMAAEHPAGDLARDVVARAITRRLNEADLSHLWLDATGIPDFPRRFPTIWRACRSVGLDPGRDWLPVAPAAHYLSGGVCADLDGATTLPALWACGETACSGVHGANRLASNSLLDGLVFGSRCVDAILTGKDHPDATGVLRGVDVAPAATPSPAPTSDGAPVAREALARIMTRDAGVLRDAASLERARAALAGLHPADPEVANLHAVGVALVEAALARRESRGTHTRLDYPDPDPAFLGRFVFGAGPTPSFVRLPQPAATR